MGEMVSRSVFCPCGSLLLGDRYEWSRQRLGSSEVWLNKLNMRLCLESFLEAQLPHCPSFWVSSSYKALFLQMTFKNCPFSKSQWGDLHGVPYTSSSHLPPGPGRGPCSLAFLHARLKWWETVPPAPSPLRCFTSCISNSFSPTSCKAPESLHRRCSSNSILLTTVHSKIADIQTTL